MLTRRGALGRGGDMRECSPDPADLVVVQDAVPADFGRRFSHPGGRVGLDPVAVEREVQHRADTRESAVGHHRGTRGNGLEEGPHVPPREIANRTRTPVREDIDPQNAFVFGRALLERACV